MKVWTIKTNECVATLDNHDEKVWTVIVRPDVKDVDDRPMLVSGGADARANLWQDVTREEENIARAKDEQRLLRKTGFSNYLMHKDYIECYYVGRCQLTSPTVCGRFFVMF